MTSSRISCPVCDQGSERLDLAYRDISDSRFRSVPSQGFDVYACRNCELLITDTREEDLDDYYPSSYRAHSPREHTKSILDRLYANYRATVESRLAPDSFSLLREYAAGDRILDVGCGNGEFMHACQTAGYTVEGCDVSSTAVDEAKATYGIPTRQGKLHELDYGVNSFDAIAFNHSFEHVSEPNAYLRTVDRLLTHDGIVLVNLPNVHSIEYSLFGRHWTDLDVPRHVYHWTPRSLDAIFGQHGFDALERRYTKSPRQLSESLRRSIAASTGITLPATAVFDPLFFGLSSLCSYRGFTGRMASVFRSENAEGTHR